MHGQEDRDLTLLNLHAEISYHLYSAVDIELEPNMDDSWTSDVVRGGWEEEGVRSSGRMRRNNKDRKERRG